MMDRQRRKYRSNRSSDGNRSLGGGGAGTSTTEFEFMKNQTGPLENPYANGEEDEDDEADSVPATIRPYGSNEFVNSRNGSSTSLRSRSTTNQSQQSARHQAGAAHPQHLSLRTRESANQAPADFDASHFSPTDSPSSRTSASSGMYAFPVPGTQIPRAPIYDELPMQPHHPNSRFTAPAAARQREVSGGGVPPQATQGPVGRGPGPRPGMHSAAQAQQAGRIPQQQPPVPDIAPHHYSQQFNAPAHVVNRSQSNSPNLTMTNGVPPQHRQSPQQQRRPSRQLQHPDLPLVSSRTATPVGGGYASQQPSQQQQHIPPSNNHSSARYSPPTGFATQPNLDRDTTPAPATSPTHANTPISVKVRVHCPSVAQTLTLVVPSNVEYLKLAQRIEVKLGRGSGLTLGLADPSGNVMREGQQLQLVKLKFKDEEDYVSIQSDEDVQMAFETCLEREGGEGNGGIAEVDLFCQR